ncbi:hypothetical protein K1719_014563 [Acacia pycnantha]|nr:hypothetical protein K1719_014563 [Acacia pycnantha]
MKADSELWRNLARLWPNVVNNISWEVGNGEHVKFWHDKWVGGNRRLSEMSIGDLTEDENKLRVADMIGWAPAPQSTTWVHPWWYAAKSFLVPLMDDIGALLASDVSRWPEPPCGVLLLRLFSKRSVPFACLGISTDKGHIPKTNNLMFVSGVLGLVPETGKFIPENVED